MNCLETGGAALRSTAVGCLAFIHTIHCALLLGIGAVLPHNLRPLAEVAESVDAADSKSAAVKSVWVRVPPSAPEIVVNLL